MEAGVAVGTSVGAATTVGVGAGVIVATSESRWFTMASTVLGISGVAVGERGVGTALQPSANAAVITAIVNADFI